MTVQEFYDWCIDRGLEDSPISVPKAKDPEVCTLGKDEIIIIKNDSKREIILAAKF